MKIFNKLVHFKQWIIRIVMRSFCSHEYLWKRNVYGDEIYMTGSLKRSWWKCNKCGKWQSRKELYTEGRS